MRMIGVSILLFFSAIMAKSQTDLPDTSSLDYPLRLHLLKGEFRQDTTKFQMILYVQDGIVHADSGYLVRTGYGNRFIFGFYSGTSQSRWFLFKNIPNVKCICPIELQPSQIYDAR